MKTRIHRDVATARRPGRPIPAAMGTVGWAQAEADRARIRTVLRAPPDWRGRARTSVPAATAKHGDIVRTRGHALDPAQPRAGAPATLQRKCANCEEEERRIQAKLQVGPACDAYEQEADRVADQVVAAADSPIARRPCAQCGREGHRLRSETALPLIQRRTGVPAGLAAAPASVDRTLAGAGQPLEPALRHDMEQRFGFDFYNVRVHAGAAAAESARDVNARAYTVGHNIVFDAGRFAPGTQEGRHLLAHELTHVVQQTAALSSPRPMLQRQPKDQPKEKDKPTLNFVGCDDRKTELEDTVSQAKALASRAIAAFEREYPLTFESTAMDANFGKSLTGDQKNTIIERYKHIRDNLETKTYTCSQQPNKKNQKKRCAEGACPGHDITIFPIFGTEVCRDRAAILLHEASHNAGACDDVDVGANYPPAQSENNAYSYEHFASDVAGGGKEGPNLGKRRPQAPR